MAAREKVGEPEFVAFVGIDWADQKHVWCLQPANSRKREGGELEHKPEVVEAWVSELRQRFGHGAIAVAVEQVKGALVYMLGKYECLHLYPGPPTMSAARPSAPAQRPHRNCSRTFFFVGDERQFCHSRLLTFGLT